MENPQYQVIARKYRPQTFASVVGQEAIVTTLKNSLRFNRLAHAYLFCGCRGTGKTTLARVFAKALNCNSPTADFEPCNACSSCLDINAVRSLDVLEIDGASNRGIDDIRQINETVGYAPSGKYKIYIIDEVHMLTKEAFNALLKTLEEPPANVKFFFATTEPHKVLPTIISRCQRFDLGRIPFDALKNKLAWIAQDLNVPCEDDVFSLIAGLSEGSLRDAESLLDQIICCAEHPITAAKVSATLGLMPRTAFFNLDKAFDEQNLSYAFELADEIFSSGKDLSYFIDQLTEHYRYLLKLKVSGSAPFPTAKLKEQYTASAHLYTEEQCLYIVDFLVLQQQQIGKTPFKRVSLEMILLHILRSKHRIALPQLVRRLSELQQKLAALPEKPIEQIAAPTPAPAPIEQVTIAKPTPQSAVVPPSPIEQAAIAKPTPQSAVVPPAPIEQVTIAKPTPQPAAVSPAPIEQPSVEDALLKKIKDKIETAPPLPSEKPNLILSKSQWEAVANSNKTSPPELKPAPEPEKKPVPPAASQSRYDTLIRFAAVELEGMIKKES